ncbi:MAG: mucoidy inhibitor MuiA family protein [Elusimicrobia bacterium]|nr:MAG: mucoidy inhibitor MuiA family protein [Elusimicrobiota bacterium]
MFNTHLLHSHGLRSAILAIGLSFNLGTLSAAEGEKQLPSRITEAKVFLSGVQVVRAASATIPAGSSTIVFTGLAQGVDPQSIQVTGKGGYNILSVNHRINYLTESPKKKEIEELQERIKKFEKDYAFEKAMQDVWVNEEQLLNKNSAIGGQQNGLTAAQLTAVNDYVRERLKITKTNWLAQQEKLNSLHVEAEKLRQQLSTLQSQAPRPTSEVVVEITSSVEVSATFAITYYVGGAGWIPAYDLRAKGVGQPIDLLMKAQVTNNTGEDWSKVELSLSSGNPTLGGVMPNLNPWTLYMHRPMQMESISSRPRMKASADAPPAAAYSEMDEKKYEDMEANYVVNNTVAYRTTTSEFVIETPFTIPSDGVPHTVGVKNHSIAASYKHYATPKLDKDAFLYARTTGWEDLNLLPGEANVFFEGTFVGQSYLQLDMPKDTLDISLGRDKGVVVERVKRKASNEKAVIGGSRTVTIGWDLTVRNTKGTSVDLEVRDQHPMSPQSEIEVKLVEKGGAAVNENNGMLIWNINLAAKETKKLGFAYTVKHPKDMPVVLE